MIISGGQTGVDRAALDAAMQLGIPTGGWCPRDRRAEDGTIPARYLLRPTASRSYAVRTEWNVRDSDGTLILLFGPPSSGTRLTIASAQTQHRPLTTVMLDTPENPLPAQATTVAAWISQNKIRVLNIAGPRGSSSDRIYPLAFEFVSLLLRQLPRDSADAQPPVALPAAARSAH
jgi:hypothetical protein